MDEQKTNMRIILKIVGVLVFGAIMIAAILQQAILPSSETIAVVGQGRVAVKPDMASLDLGILTLQMETPELAVSQTTEKVNKIKAALTELGISEDNQQVTGYAFNPQYEDPNATSVPTENVGGVNSPKPAKIIGYNGFQQISVKVPGIDKDPQLIDRLVARVTKEGVSQIGLVNFIVSDIEEVKQAARDEAIMDGKKKADDMMKVAGIKMGKIIGWSENLLTVPGQIYSEGNYTYNYNSFSFPGNNNNSISGQPSSQTEVVIEVTMSYSVRK